MAKPCIITQLEPGRWSGRCEMDIPDGGPHLRTLDILTPRDAKKTSRLVAFQFSITTENTNAPVFAVEDIRYHEETLQDGLRVLAGMDGKSKPSEDAYFLDFTITYETA